MATSKGKAKRNIKRKVQRMTVFELQKFLRVTRPEVCRLSSMIAHAEYELRRRGVTSEHNAYVAGEADQE